MTKCLFLFRILLNYMELKAYIMYEEIRENSLNKSTVTGNPAVYCGRRLKFVMRKNLAMKFKDFSAYRG